MPWLMPFHALPSRPSPAVISTGAERSQTGLAVISHREKFRFLRLKRTFQKKPPPSLLTPSHTRQASSVNQDDADDKRRPSRCLMANVIHDKYCQWENGDFPSRPGMSLLPPCRCPDLGYTSVGAEVGGPFREWAKVKLVGGMALLLERVASSIQCLAHFQTPCRNSIFFFLSKESALITRPDIHLLHSRPDTVHITLYPHRPRQKIECGSTRRPRNRVLCCIASLACRDR